MLLTPTGISSFFNAATEIISKRRDTLRVLLSASSLATAISRGTSVHLRSLRDCKGQFASQGGSHLNPTDWGVLKSSMTSRSVSLHNKQTSGGTCRCTSDVP